MKSSDPEAELPIFEETILSLVDLGEEELSKSILFSEDDHFGFMAYSFCTKQIEHAKSLLALVSAKRFVDTLIIGRSLLEGMALLIWASSNKDERARKWRAFVFVSDYRLAMEQVAKGQNIEIEARNNMIAGLTEFGVPFLKKGKELIIDFVTDNFKSGWVLDDEDKRIFTEDYFREIGADLNYGIYLDMSDWIHWNVRGLGLNLVRNGDYLSYDFQSKRSAGYSLSSSIQAIIHSFEVLDAHFNLGMSGALRRIESQYLEKVSAVRK